MATVLNISLPLIDMQIILVDLITYTHARHLGAFELQPPNMADAGVIFKFNT
jgi:hypothetical protein